MKKPEKKKDTRFIRKGMKGLLFALLAVIGAVTFGYIQENSTVVDAVDKAAGLLPAEVRTLIFENKERKKTAVPKEIVKQREKEESEWPHEDYDEMPFPGGNCQVFPSGHNHINNNTFVPFRYNPDDKEAVAKLNPTQVAAAMGINYPGLPHDYTIHDEEGNELESFADCKRMHGYVYLLRNGDLWVWPAISFYNKIRVEFEEINSKGELTKRHLILETLSGRPRLFFVKDFIMPSESAGLISKAESGLQRSTVHSNTGDFPEKTRTSENAWVFADQDPFFANLESRIAKVLKIPFELVPDAGATQVLRYLSDQYYNLHHDAFQTDNKDGTIFWAYRRNRFATVLYYLTDVEGGGETNFPSVNQTDPNKHEYTCNQGLNVKPIANSAVIFYNLQTHDNIAAAIDPWAYHAACKVKAGVKWAANRWIYNRMRPSPEVLKMDPSEAPYGYKFDVKVDNQK